MEIIYKLVREAFIVIYFDMGYLNKLHNYFIDKINSYEKIYRDKHSRNRIYILNDNKGYPLPQIPLEFIES